MTEIDFDLLRTKNHIFKFKSYIDTLETYEKTVCLIYIYLNKKSNIFDCSLLFETTEDILKDFFLELNIYQNPENFRFCIDCLQILNIDNFNKGNMIRCKSCYKERKKIYDNQHHSDNKEKRNNQSKTYHQNNKEHLNQICRENNKIYYQNNKEEIKKKHTKRRLDNPGLWNHYWMKRKCLKNKATPPWSDLNKIEEIYLKAKKLEEQDGIKRHVDHIIPLNHPLVCGLHIPENLQILTQEENLKKYNHFEPYII